MPDEVKLLPCPLCASEQITTAPDREFGAVTWDVICKACGVRVTRDLEEQAIAAWNTRAIEVADDVVERVANMLREAFRAQFDQVYFADHFDRDLFNAGPQEWSEFEGGVKLADRFDLEHIARAAIEATRPPIGTDEVVERLWRLHMRGLSYASDTPAVNLLLADMAEGLKVAVERITHDQSLSDRIDVLTRALEPFAKIAELREGYNDKDDTIVCVNIVAVRNARAALHQEATAPGAQL